MPSQNGQKTAKTNGNRIFWRKFYSLLISTFHITPLKYKNDQQFAKIFSLFASLAIVISCLGLWGLASFTTMQKMKEVGIRKVLGASSGSIVNLLSGQFLKLIFIASIIAMPVAWYGIGQWLDGFAFHIGMDWDLFVVPILVLVVVSMVTVSLQVLKGASTNPTEVLKE